MTSPAPVPGWYPDPFAPDRLRWWDGATWTEHVQNTAPAVPPPAPAVETARAPHASGTVSTVADTRPERDPERVRLARITIWIIVAGIAVAAIAGILVLLNVPLDTTIMRERRGRPYEIGVWGLGALPLALVVMLLGYLARMPRWTRMSGSAGGPGPRGATVAYFGVLIALVLCALAGQAWFCVRFLTVAGAIAG